MIFGGASTRCVPLSALDNIAPCSMDARALYSTEASELLTSVPTAASLPEHDVLRTPGADRVLGDAPHHTQVRRHNAQLLHTAVDRLSIGDEQGSTHTWRKT